MQLGLQLELTDTFDSRSPLELVSIPSRTYRNSFWCATWNDNNLRPNFGRLLKNGPKRAVIQHWIIDNVSSLTDHFISPNSTLLILKPCLGCNLHTPSLVMAPGGRTDSRLTDISCLFAENQVRIVNLKHLQQGLPKFVQQTQYELRTPLLQLQVQIRNTLFPSITQPPIFQRFSVGNAGSNLDGFNLRFHYGNNFVLDTGVSSRTFIKNIFSALYFHRLLSLDRWLDINLLHFHNMIDWSSTWKLRKYNPMGSNQSTSFEYSAYSSFLTKVQLNELPLLCTLQFRRPDLYDPVDNCYLCHNQPEDWTHLWQCNFLSLKIAKVVDDTLSLFRLEVISRSTDTSFTLPSAWFELDC